MKTDWRIRKNEDRISSSLPVLVRLQIKISTYLKRQRIWPCISRPIRSRPPQIAFIIYVKGSVVYTRTNGTKWHAVFHNRKGHFFDDQLYISFLEVRSELFDFVLGEIFIYVVFVRFREVLQNKRLSRSTVNQCFGTQQ